MRRFRITVLFAALVAVYWYGHTHLVYSWGWAPSDRILGNVFTAKMVDVKHFQSLYEFNSWLGWNATYQKPVTWNVWFGLLLLASFPSKTFGIIIFVIPIWIKLPVLFLLYILVMKLTPRRRAKVQAGQMPTETTSEPFDSDSVDVEAKKKASSTRVRRRDIAK